MCRAPTGVRHTHARVLSERVDDDGAQQPEVPMGKLIYSMITSLDGYAIDADG